MPGGGERETGGICLLFRYALSLEFRLELSRGEVKASSPRKRPYFHSFSLFTSSRRSRAPLASCIALRSTDIT